MGVAEDGDCFYHCIRLAMATVRCVLVTSVSLVRQLRTHTRRNFADLSLWYAACRHRRMQPTESCQSTAQNQNEENQQEITGAFQHDSWFCIIFIGTYDNWDGMHLIRAGSQGPEGLGGGGRNGANAGALSGQALRYTTQHNTIHACMAFYD
jgi:hypothetical protein